MSDTAHDIVTALATLGRAIQNDIDDLPSYEIVRARAKAMATYRRAESAVKELIALRHGIQMQLLSAASRGE